jgi:uncharacterized membrane protein
MKMRASRDPMTKLRLSPLAIASNEGTDEGGHLELPSPNSVLRHACPVVLESVIAPVTLFYVVLVTAGFRGALIAALGWSYLAIGRRLHRGERISTMLLLGTVLLTVRTVVSFITGSAFLYFIQPTAMTVAVCLVLVASALTGRPFTQRFAADFCPIGPELLARPRVHRFFVHITFLWAAALILNAGIVLWLLLDSPLGTFVLEREAVTLSLTAIAIFLSITRFVSVLRRDGISVGWGRRGGQLLPSEVG